MGIGPTRLRALRDAEGQGWLGDESREFAECSALVEELKHVEQEMIIDLFAGGGGASHGIWMATGRHPCAAVNHDREAILMHSINHPTTVHYLSDVRSINPWDVTRGRPVGLLWASPDCKHFSKAKGGVPVKKEIRDLAWIVVRWAQIVRPRIICLENVEEFITWCPLVKERRKNRKTGKNEWVKVPDKSKKGQTFQAWVAALRRCGYVVEWKEMRASDLDTPTTRNRLYVIARCDGQPIVWPEYTNHREGKGGKPRWRRAADCIDWTLPTRSIFGRKTKKGKPKPLAKATMARIAKGIDRFVLQNRRPFLVPVTHAGKRPPHDLEDPFRTITGAARGEIALVNPHMMVNTTGHGPSDLEDPVPTVTTGNHHYVVAPTTNGVGGRAGQSRPRSVEEPMATITAKGDTVLTTTHLAPFGVPRYGEREGQEPRTHDVTEPMPTVVTTANGFNLCAAYMAQHNTGVTGHEMEEPVSTITQRGSHQNLVTSHLFKYYGQKRDGEHRGQEVEAPLDTVTTENRFGLVSGHLTIQRGKSYGRDLEAPAPTSTSRSDLGVVAGHLEVMRNNAKGQDLETPAPTVCAGGTHLSIVLSFLTSYYGTGTGQDLKSPLRTITTKDRHGLVTAHAAVEIEGQHYALTDIHMRMLSPRELYRAQGFPDSYVIDPVLDGKKLTKTAQIRMCGNSVCPPVAAAIVKANFTPQPAKAGKIKAVV